MSKPRATAFDYVVAALNPVLIILMQVSLGFFLLDVFYQGNHLARLHFIFFCFIVGIVLVARISIDQGKDRATLFALPLGLVSLIAINRFVEFSGVWSQLNLLLNIALMALIWWTAHKLTWDCTVIDESEEAMSQGLTQFLGPEAGPADQPGATKTLSAVTDQPDAPPSSGRQSWWRRLTSTTKRPHPHGLWIIYFSLAALPIFGVGHLFFNRSNADHAASGILLLLGYLLGAFLLLVTTSLIGLRKYLRRRRLEMPPHITASWLTLGAVLSALVLAGVLILPRSLGDFSVRNFAWNSASPDEISTSSLGRGTSDQRSDEASKQNSSNASPNENGKSRATESDAQDDRQQASADKATHTSLGSNRNNKHGDDQSKSRPDERSQADDSPKNSSRPSEGRKPGQDDSSDSSRDASAPEHEHPTSDDKSADRSSAQSSSKVGGEEHAADSTSPPPDSPSQSANAWLRFLGHCLKVCFWLVLLSVAIFFGWKHRRELYGAWRELLRDLRDWFCRLLGRKATAAAPIPAPLAEPRPRARRFSDFHDPFASGRVDDLSFDALVQYSFEALQAWAGEFEAGRSADQTPQEFVNQVAHKWTHLAAPARALAGLYNHVAYAGASTKPRDTTALQQLWEKMQATRLAS